RAAFENARKITTIVFDKTGTLTKGSHEVSQIVSFDPLYTEDRILQLTSAVEAPSEHHIAKGLLRKSTEKFVDIPSVKSFKYTAGIGVNGVVEGLHINAGGYLMLEAMGIKAPKKTEDETQTKIFLTVEHNLIGYITFEDEIRESSYGAIENLKKQGIKCHLLTGDNEAVAKSVAAKLGLDDYKSQVLPDQKQLIIKDLQNQGEFVAMTGDGVNDAPALAQADIGIAIGSGTDVAAETADIILVDSDPKDINKLILFGKATHRKMVQNLAWATGYNVVALPLATGFVPGLIISPAFGAALMAISTVICAANAQLLKRAMKM
ncbi:MAG: Cu2+-exporting ATPase, partial [Bacteroidia bacterium]